MSNNPIFESLRSPLVTQWQKLNDMTDRRSLADYARDELHRYLPDIDHGSTTLSGTIYNAVDVDLKGRYDGPHFSDFLRCTFLGGSDNAVSVRLYGGVNDNEVANMGLQIEYIHPALAALHHEFSYKPFPSYHTSHKTTGSIDDYGIKLPRNTAGVMDELHINHNGEVQRGVYSINSFAEALGRSRDSCDPWKMWSRFFYENDYPILQTHIGKDKEHGFMADQNHLQELKDWLRQTQLEKNIPGRIELDLKDEIVEHSVRTPNNQSVMFTDVLPQRVTVAYPVTAPAIPRRMSRT